MLRSKPAGSLSYLNLLTLDLYLSLNDLQNCSRCTHEVKHIYGDISMTTHIYVRAPLQFVSHVNFPPFLWPDPRSRPWKGQSVGFTWVCDHKNEHGNKKRERRKGCPHALLGIGGTKSIFLYLHYLSSSSITGARGQGAIRW